jgi:hypothetical protein
MSVFSFRPDLAEFRYAVSFGVVVKKLPDSVEEVFIGTIKRELRLVVAEVDNSDLVISSPRIPGVFPQVILKG